MIEATSHPLVRIEDRALEKTSCAPRAFLKILQIHRARLSLPERLRYPTGTARPLLARIRKAGEELRVPPFPRRDAFSAAL
jgi:hypothetical protein